MVYVRCAGLSTEGNHQPTHVWPPSCQLRAYRAGSGPVGSTAYCASPSQTLRRLKFVVGAPILTARWSWAPEVNVTRWVSTTSTELSGLTVALTSSASVDRLEVLARPAEWRLALYSAGQASHGKFVRPS